MKPLPTSSFGYPVREPVPSEQVFFALNPNVGGYAAEDGAIVLNEGARNEDRYLSNRELGGVARNEASRLYMRERNIIPDFSLTKDQELKFQGSAYGSNPEALKQSIAARIITGDPSAGKITQEQKDFSQSLLKQMRANSEASATNPEPKFKGFPSSHPFVSNKDGSKSNVKLATVGLGDKTFVIPTMVGGKDLSIQQAVKTAKDYGLSSYPSFTNPQDAINWSKKYHGSIDEKGKLKSK
jgi:hypothetical protein